MVGGSAPKTTCLGWGGRNGKAGRSLRGHCYSALRAFDGSFSSVRLLEAGGGKWDKPQCTVSMATTKNGASVSDVRRFSGLQCSAESLENPQSGTRFTPVSSQRRPLIGTIQFALPRDHQRSPIVFSTGRLHRRISPCDQGSR
ncbi:hypothetical protein CORC01_08528 [Colletotrichum orchidophilum]|uniref:Uncharacterized protein n=1 Tax=Colletotrichum orchidophilum TaxID=1209926 RepID=A0A1G4B416_9PEZI|nr:uncharacterized protein CORC01_08528 [Colletotrichum orchidophilum]OHE96151.1 hypothetical protein CORC01_08528 [Colletotrichum orchidophilum]